MSRIFYFCIGLIIGMIVSRGTVVFVGNTLRNNRRASDIRILRDRIRWSDESELGVSMDLHPGTVALYPHDQEVPEGWTACRGQRLWVNEEDALFLLAVAAWEGESPEDAASEHRDGGLGWLELNLPHQTEQERDKGVIKIIKVR